MCKNYIDKNLDKAYDESKKNIRASIRMRKMSGCCTMRKKYANHLNEVNHEQYYN